MGQRDENSNYVTLFSADKISPYVKGCQVGGALGELLLGNGLKYLLYHYKIWESEIWTGVTPGKWKVISDEYPKSKAV